MKSSEGGPISLGEPIAFRYEKEMLPSQLWRIVLLTFILPMKVWCDGSPAEGVYDSEVTFEAPDHSFSIKQYRCSDDGTKPFQIWLCPKDKKHSLIRLLDETYYPGFFSLSPNGEWLLQEQKLCAGSASVYLYHRDANGCFTSVTSGYLGDKAWEFFAKQPGLDPEKIPTFHKDMGLAEWRKDRYLILKLSGRNDPYFLD